MGNYDEMDYGMNNEDSSVLTILKGILGAIIGAAPGMALWIILGKLGYIASMCGFVLAIGIVYGYNFMTKRQKLPIAIGAVVCLVIMLLALFFSNKIVWTWEIADQFKEFFPSFKNELIAYISANYPEFSLSDIRAVVTDEYVDSALVQEFGFSDPTFSNCFSHFGDLLEYMEIKSDFIWSLGKSALFAFLGGGAVIFGVEGKAKKNELNY